VLERVIRNAYSPVMVASLLGQNRRGRNKYSRQFELSVSLSLTSEIGRDSRNRVRFSFKLRRIDIYALNIITPKSKNKRKEHNERGNWSHQQTLNGAVQLQNLHG